MDTPNQDGEPTPEAEALTVVAGADKLLNLPDFMADVPAPKPDTKDDEPQPNPSQDGDPDDTSGEPVADGDAGAEDKSEGDDEGGTPDPDVQLYEVVANGETMEVTLEDMAKGWSRTEDYTRKTQKHAETVRTWEAEKATEAETLRVSRQKYDDGLVAIEKVMGEPQDTPNWDDVRQKQPNEYPTLYADFQRREQQRASVKAERERVAAEEVQAQADAKQRHLTVQAAKLAELFPEEYKTEDTVKAFNEGLVKYGESVGFTPEEIGSFSDHRAIAVLDKARRYDALEKKTDERKKDLKTKVRKLPTIKPGSRSATKSEGQKAAGAARKRLATSGSAVDAAAAIEHLFDD